MYYLYLKNKNKIESSYRYIKWMFNNMIFNCTIINFILFLKSPHSMYVQYTHS